MRRDEKTKRPPGEKNHKHRDLDPGCPLKDHQKVQEKAKRKSGEEETRGNHRVPRGGERGVGEEGQRRDGEAGQGFRGSENIISEGKLNSHFLFSFL